MNRRSFLRGAGAATTSGVVLGGPFSGFLARAAGAQTAPRAALVPVPDERDGVVRLHVPEGFHYRSFHDTESGPIILSDGTTLPGRHDGMAAFPGPNGTTVLVRNHELNNPGPAFGPSEPEPYDAMAQGGTTTIHVTGRGEVLQAYTSLNGTQMNCAGGRMPWGSWITCEETVNGPDVGPDFTGVSNVPLEKPHGYIFEVPAGGQSNREPITRAGRFAHEAVAFDPYGRTLYMTEDNFGYPSGFYRYKPRTNPLENRKIANDGRLQMLAVQGMPNANLAASQPAGATYQVRWVDIEDPNPSFPYTPGETAPTPNDVALNYVGSQGRAQGAAWFSRLEGCYYDNGVVYFVSTQGGGPPEPGPSDTVQGFGNGYGQVWAYHLKTNTLHMLFESPGPETLDFPDNITTSPSGTLVICEDSSGDNYIRAMTRAGRVYNVVLNRLHSSVTGNPRYGDEFAGDTFSTYSADGQTLFFNIQASFGISFAMWGPWDRIGLD